MNGSRVGISGEHLSSEFRSQSHRVGVVKSKARKNNVIRLTLECVGQVK